MSFYEPQGWQAPARQSSWEQPPTPSRSGASSTSQSREDGPAFAAQFEEVDRALENLVKSGKLFTSASRRDSMPPMAAGRSYGDPGMHGGMSQRPSMDFDPSRSHSASNLQNFYASQRYQGRQSEAEQVLQAKRRMAAQRERELRNYHQEQQYNRSVLAEMSSAKSDRSMSPNTMSEEGRRELLARQHRALYGNGAGNFLPQGGFGEEGSSGRDPGPQGPTSGTAGIRGNSPRSTDPFGMGQVTGQQGAVNKEMPAHSLSNPDAGRTETATSPVTSGASTQFGNIDASIEQAANTPTSPPGGESPPRGVIKSTTAPIGSGKGPIGTRMPQQQQQQPAPNQTITKRSTTPLTSPLNNFGFASSEQTSKNERSGSSNSNPSAASKETGSGMGTWGTGSGVWGSNKIGATSVWG